jgi:hypothetical protein
MVDLLLIDVALCAALIMVAACVMVRRWRRSSDRPAVPDGAVAELAGEGTARRKTAVVPGFGDETLERDLGATMPAEPEQAAGSQISVAADPGPGPYESTAEPDEQQAAAGAVTNSERVGSYYDQADQSMAAYLAAQGWTEEPRTHDPG